MNHRVLVAFASGLALSSGFAVAQEDNNLEEVVVIGSRIPRVKAEGPAPVTTIQPAAASRFNVERLARDSVARIADQTGESAFLSIARGVDCVCLIREEGTFRIRTHVLQAGDRLPLGVGSAGLAILSAMGDERVGEMIEANRERLAAKHPNYSPELLWQLVAETRELGYAVNRGLILTGSWGLAAAVRDTNGWPVCAVSITGIESRLKAPREAELGRLLIRESQRLGELFRANR